MTAMRVSLAPAAKPIKEGGLFDENPKPLLAVSGARVILGGDEEQYGLTQPISPNASSLFGPRAACVAGPGGPLFVSDTGHHRVLIWQQMPEMDGAPADLVIGQPGFRHEGRNAKGDIGAATLNVPAGIAAADGILAVADAWNHRVLIWHGYPERSNRPADVALGQADFASGLANRGEDSPRADTLNWCYGVALCDGKLIVADTGNRRVLIWDNVPEASGAPADMVLGQRDFRTRDENAGECASALGMRWPHGIATGGGMLFVSDAGNNRVMVWKVCSARDEKSFSEPEGHRERFEASIANRSNRVMPLAQRLKAGDDGVKSRGVPCDFVIGQGDPASVDHNRAAYYLTASAMSMPYGVAVHGGRLVVADTSNSRLLGFDIDALEMGASATRLAAQPNYAAKGDNRWGAPRRDSLCWPYGVAAAGDTLIIADSGNNRVLLWESASD